MTDEIIIVGGGIGGLTTALALAGKGRRTRVLERATEFKPVGAGLQLGPNAFKVFNALGLTDAVRKHATFPRALVIKDALTAEDLSHIEVADSVKQRFGYPYAMMHRADLHAVLLAACRASALIALNPGHELIAFEDAGDHVHVSTKEAQANRQDHRASALMGADGL